MYVLIECLDTFNWDFLVEWGLSCYIELYRESFFRVYIVRFEIFLWLYLIKKRKF